MSQSLPYNHTLTRWYKMCYFIGIILGILSAILLSIFIYFIITKSWRVWLLSTARKRLGIKLQSNLDLCKFIGFAVVCFLVLVVYLGILICQMTFNPLLLTSSIKEDRSQMPGKKRQKLFLWQFEIWFTSVFSYCIVDVIFSMNTNFSIKCQIADNGKWQLNTVSDWSL